LLNSTSDFLLISNSNSGEIKQLAGCDRLTIGPKFLEEMQKSDSEVTCMLDASKADYDGEKLTLDEKTFRVMYNDDACAVEKVAEGIRGFSADLVKLENFVKEKM
jgi:transaldolase